MRAVETHPLQALWFVKAVTLLGSISAVLVSIPCGIFLWMYWIPCGFCNRPLKYWLLVHCAMQLLQAPVRLRFFLRLCHIPQHEGDLQEMFKRLTSSSAWQNSKMVSVASYAWFVLEVVWLLNSVYCKQCPGMYRLCISVVFLAVARLLITLVLFYHTFKQGAEDTSVQSKPQGASQSLIDSIPCEKFCADLSDDSCDSCAVCLNDFEENDLLRRLPCNHSFHVTCVDKWLKQNKNCPLCVQDVEVMSQQQADKRRPRDSMTPSCCQRVGTCSRVCSN